MGFLLSITVAHIREDQVIFQKVSIFWILVLTKEKITLVYFYPFIQTAQTATASACAAYSSTETTECDI